MKKLLLLSALLIFACSSDDSNDNNSNYFFEFELFDVINRVEGNYEDFFSGQVETNTCLTSTRDYEHADSARSFIGFRTVQDYLGTDATANDATN